MPTVRSLAASDSEDRVAKPLESETAALIFQGNQQVVIVKPCLYVLEACTGPGMDSKFTMIPRSVIALPVSHWTNTH